MRTYILTDREAEVLANYLSSDIKLNGFSVLILRLKKAEPLLSEQMKMIKATLQKLRKGEGK